MDSKGFFSSLKRQISFHFKDNTTREVDGSGDEREDAMYEDFVLVTDESLTEASADGLPTYSSAVIESNCEDRLPSTLLTLRNAVKSCEPQHLIGDVPTPVSAICDIPFQLHTGLCAKQRIHNILQGVDLETRVFNEEKYFHDFTQENLCIRDLCCDEETFNS